MNKTTSAATKRSFLMRAFYPYGDDACRVVGMSGSSSDVIDSESKAAKIDLDAVSNDEIATAVDRAAWYMDAAEALMETNHPQYRRHPQEDFVAFYAAMKSQEN